MTMTLSQRISEDLKTAMKAKDTVALNVIRGVKSAIKYAAIEKLGAEGELGETDCLAVVRREIKKRQDSVTAYETAARADLAETEKAEIAVLEKYLPAAMSDSELVALVESVIAELGATTKKDMGGVMKVLQERAAGRADNRLLSTEVAKRLQ
ncbi:MAG: GatB/YqeY domain-containing protein [Prosthecobacter sp.]|nr:GatB/YqeY domain-containing protein [Prosthecobacter sp.]